MKIKKLLTIVLTGIMISSISSVSVFAKDVNNAEYEEVSSYVNDVYVNLNTEDKEELIEELYKEKNTVSLPSFEKSRALMQEVEIFKAFNEVNKEEEYVVELINSKGNNTTLSDWKFNLQYLENNYDELTKTNDVNIEYINSYIDAYQLVLQNEDVPEEKVNTVTTLKQARASYNSTAAVSYANKYYYNYNSSYPDWNIYGGDCANFVSQCLYAGGKSMTSTWKSSGSSCNTSKVTAAWRGANEFRYYWQDNCSSYKTFTSVGRTSYNYGFRGDAVSLLNSNGRAAHTMIITGYDNPDFVLSAHTSDTNSASLESKASGYSKFIIYNM